MQPLATPHAVRRQITLDFQTCYWQTTQGQATIQAVRWTRPHFPLDCPESAAFNQSLKAAAGSTGVGAMPAMDTSKKLDLSIFSMWAQDLSISHVGAPGASGAFNVGKLTFRFRSKRVGFSPVDALILALVATRKLQFMFFANQGRIARGQLMIGSVLHGATPASIRVWFLKAGTIIISRLISQI
jgi:hypothetical protein